MITLILQAFVSWGFNPFHSIAQFLYLLTNKSFQEVQKWKIWVKCAIDTRKCDKDYILFNFTNSELCYNLLQLHYTFFYFNLLQLYDTLILLHMNNNIKNTTVYKTMKRNINAFLCVLE